VILKNGMEYEQTTDLESVMPQLDILYMTRVQGERFSDCEEYLRLRDSYILTPDKLKNAKPDMSILHPLPRVNEISVKIDDDPRACYFKQVRNGKYMRMALILKLLEDAKKNPVRENRMPKAGDGQYLFRTLRCRNHHCITTTEQELEQIFKITDAEKRICRCIYCEAKEMMK
jgi:aspartate carbamoyltransferase catalytic subunit